MSELDRDDITSSNARGQMHLHRYALALEQIAGLTILNLGSGDGSGAALLATRAAKVVGVDPSPARVAAAETRLGASGRLSFQTAETAALPFPDDQFDAVIAFSADWPETAEAALAEVRRVLKPEGFAMLRGPAPGPGGDDSFGAAVRRTFKHRFALAQRIVAASAIGPAGGTASPNTADYRGYTTAPGAGLTAGVVRMGRPEQILWVVSERALPRAESADSVFLDPSHDLWTTARLGNEPAAPSPPAPRPSPGSEMAILAALVEQLAGGPVEGDLTSLARALGQANVRLAVQDIRMADAAKLDAALEAAGAEYRRLEQRLEESRSDAAAARTLALENRTLAERLTERLAVATRDAEARKQMVDETHEQIQTLAIGLEQHRAEAGTASALAARLTEELDQSRRDADALRALAEERDRELHDLRRDIEAVRARATEIEGELTYSRGETAATSALAIRQADEAADVQDRLSQAEALRRDLEEEISAAQTRLVDLAAERDAANVRVLEANDLIQAAQAEREDLLAQLDTVRIEVETARRQRGEADETARQERDAILAERDAAQQENETIRAERDAARTEAETALRRARTEGRKARALMSRPSQRQDFSAALRDRMQQAALADIAAHRVGTAAVETVRDARRELADALSHAAGAAARSPASGPPTRIDTGPMRPISVRKRLRSALRNDTPVREAPTAPLEAVAALFDPVHYLAANNVRPRPGETPFDHYVRHGRQEGFSTHPMIDPEWIQLTWPETARPFDLFAYINDVGQHDLWPNALFEADHYRRTNRDIVDAGVNPLAHYLSHGWREGRQPNQFFDNDWYLATHEDVLAAGLNPLQHYFSFGAAELRRPHPLFDHGFYLDRYPDVSESGMDAYTHFIAHGRAEGRLPSRRLEDLKRLESVFDGAPVNELVFGAAPETRLRLLDDGFWPPRPTGQYWLPQALRDLIIDRFGEDQAPLNLWLFSLIERYGDAPETFDASTDCKRLIARAKVLASTPIEGRPVASIIVPVYNNLLYTLTCIVSVLESAPHHSFEILVGDDGSSDRTAEAMALIGGLVRHVRHPENLGFLGNCNTTAEKAAGEYVVFLNNDTIVFPGWLDRLIEAMVADQKIGFIGSKLLNGDGTLQEAGGVFWADGSAWNFGRNSDPMAPEFNYLKDVDYVSGASIALPTTLWRQLGGFDPLYAPAYCEDADLAFRVRQAGYRSVYHPHSVLVHHEGRSHGRDLTSGVKAYQVINQEKFLHRWRDTLKRENFPNATSVFLARDRSAGKPHILVVDHYVPQWDRDAGSRTLYLYIRMLLDHGFAVTFWADNLHEDRIYTPPLQAMGVEVIYSAAYHGAFERWFGENAQYFDYAFLSRPHVAEAYIHTIAATGRTKIIYYGHDLHFRRARAAFEITRDRSQLVEAARWESIEIAVCKLSDVVLYPGHEEVAEVKARVPDRISVLPFPITIFNPEELAAGLAAVESGLERNPYDLMFVGGFSHDPNVGGVVWFVREVMPRLRAADPRFHFKIAGSNAPDEILALDGDDVSVLGRISDAQLDALYAGSALAIVPLLYGGGVKGKVIEAMARGVPVVMTSVGAQGIPGAEHLGYVEDDPQRMAEAVLAAVADRADALSRARRALDFIDQAYSTHAVKTLLAPEIPELGASPDEPDEI